jgi:transglutaminase-like putative cysteine protease
MARSLTAAAPILDRESYKISRYALFWLFIAVVAVIVPHVGRMPFWLTAICVFCLAGRYLIFQGRMSYPGKKLKLLIVCSMMLMVAAQYGRDVFSTDATVALLVVGITLKLLEMHQKRDVLVVLYLAYFTVVAEFIYSQAILVALYMGLAVIVITSALMALNQNADNQAPWRTVRLSAVILLQSAPLMLVFFLFAPRISPLWSVPVQANTGTTGLSDSMAPGDIGNLTRSAEVAFRVQFKGKAPPYSELYWRALTLDDFTGREWRRTFNDAQFFGADVRDQKPWYTNIEYQGAPVDYNVIMEPTFQNWIFTLMIPQIGDERMIMTRDFQVGSKRPVSQRFSYDARSFLQYQADTGDEGNQQRRSRNLPDGSNPQARAFAQQLYASVTSDREYINAVLENFRQQNFFYTLNPPTLGQHSVDEFLFSTRQGFCEHYASSFTFLMRAAGIPARVVTGYQGGSFNPYDGTLTVRQYDAHAWSEVWLPGEGWIRVDPTAAVAPERISQGSEITLQQEESFMDDATFSLMRFRSSVLLNDLRLRLEMIDYAWNRFVLNYNQDMQFNLISRLFGRLTQAKVIVAVLGFMLVLGVFIALTVFGKSGRAAKAPAIILYLRFCACLSSRGYARMPGETPLHYLERVRRLNPRWANDMQTITTLFTELAFSSEANNPEKLQQLRKYIRRFRLLN